MNDKIRSEHLNRKAILYVRQSSGHQVTHHLESRRMQYAMKARLQELGWAEIQIVDEDQGQSADGTAERSGFDNIVSDVYLGRVGVVAAIELSRLSRNSRDWLAFTQRGASSGGDMDKIVCTPRPTPLTLYVFSQKYVRIMSSLRS